MSNLEILKPVANEERTELNPLNQERGNPIPCQARKTKPVQLARENSTCVKRMEFGLLSIDDLGIVF